MASGKRACRSGRRSRKRDGMGLKIIGAGFGRTGTQSLQRAIEMLGFGPCHHMYEVRRNPRLTAMWQAIVDGGSADWDAVFKGYESTVDWPASAYWREIGAHYPQAKVILSVRNPADWYDSMLQTIVPSATVGAEVDPDPNGRAGSALIRKVALEGIFQGRIADRDFALHRFEEHRKAVIAEIPPERLLVMDVREGWAPLCAFLAVAAPDAPFPSGNSISEFRARKSYLSRPDPS